MICVATDGQSAMLGTAIGLAMRDACGAEAMIDALQRERDARFGWCHRDGVRVWRLEFGGITAESTVSAADAGWRWAALAGPAGTRWRAQLLLHRLDNAPAGARGTILLEAAREEGWVREPRDNIGAVMPTAYEISVHDITAHGAEEAEAVRNWIRIARATLGDQEARNALHS